MSVNEANTPPYTLHTYEVNGKAVRESRDQKAEKERKKRLRTEF